MIMQAIFTYTKNYKITRKLTKNVLKNSVIRLSLFVWAIIYETKPF